MSWRRCMKKFCIALREHAADVINFENKKMLPLTKKRAKITSGFNRILHLQKKFHTKTC